MRYGGYFFITLALASGSALAHQKPPGVVIAMENQVPCPPNLPEGCAGGGPGGGVAGGACVTNATQNYQACVANVNKTKKGTVQGCKKIESAAIKACGGKT
jgi:hypothetical protein